MGALLALLLLTCPDAPGVQGVPCRNGTPNRIRATSGLPMRKNIIGVGMLTATPLCTSLQAGDLAGAWWCLKGDGTMQAGSSTTFSPSASVPIVEDWIVVPSGPNGSTESMTLFNPIAGSQNQWYVSPVVAAPTGSFTTCAIGMVDGVNKAAGAGPPQAIVMYATDAFANGSWIMQYASSGAGAGMTTYATGIVNVPNLIPAVAREQGFECGVFQASTLVKSCTFRQGTASAQCVQSAHATANISAVAKKWIVGAADITGAPDEVWRGFFRGAFFTEKALSTADITRIGTALLPANPSSLTFTRAGVRTCCVGPQCVVLSPNVPCVLNNRVQTEGAGSNANQNSERPAISGLSSDPANVATTPTLSASAGFSPFGVKTADEIFFPETPNLPAGGYSARMLMPDVPSTPVATSFFIKAMPGGVSSGGGVIQVCHYTNAAPPPPATNGYTCSPGVQPVRFTSDWTWVTFPSATSLQEVIGNLTYYSGASAVIGADGGTGAIDVLIFGTQEEIINDAGTSYINTQHVGAPAVRAAETCVGAGC